MGLRSILEQSENTYTPSHKGTSTRRSGSVSSSSINATVIGQPQLLTAGRMQPQLTAGWKQQQLEAAAADNWLNAAAAADSWQPPGCSSSYEIEPERLDIFGQESG